jgi:nucleotide-binding universal stress UspA family protein
MGRIVVGVDGSEGSRHALHWAAEQATLRGSDLEVITTFEHHLPWRGLGADSSLGAAAAEAIRQEAEDRKAEATRHAQGLVDRMVAELDGPKAVATAVHSAHPAQTLIDRSRNADLLVVGSRGRGGFKTLMLGSVSQQCAQHAECPVVIIRPKPRNQA